MITATSRTEVQPTTPAHAFLASAVAADACFASRFLWFHPAYFLLIATQPGF